MATTLVTADPVESVTWRLHDQLVRFLCRVVFMQDAFDFFVYFGVLDFGHVRVRRPMRKLFNFILKSI